MEKLIDVIVDLLRAGIVTENSEFSNILNVFRGDPRKIAETSTPAICVVGLGTTVERRGTKIDGRRCSVAIRVVFNEKDFYSSNDTDQNTVSAHKKIIQMIEKLDTNSMSYSHKSIVGLILSQVVLKYNGGLTRACIWCNVDDINYAPVLDRPFKSYEAEIKLTAYIQGDR